MLSNGVRIMVWYHGHTLLYRTVLASLLPHWRYPVLLTLKGTINVPLGAQFKQILVYLVREAENNILRNLMMVSIARVVVSAAPRGEGGKIGRATREGRTNGVGAELLRAAPRLAARRTDPASP